MILKFIREALGRIIIFINFMTKPSKIVRSREAQEWVNKEAKNMALYQFYACPFCIRTRRTIEKLNIPIEYRDAQNNPAHRQELLKGGGDIKVPCLRIEENGRTRWMYESGDIIQYLHDRFGQGKGPVSQN